MYKKYFASFIIITCVFVLSLGSTHATESNEEDIKPLDFQATKAATIEEAKRKIIEEKALMKQKLGENNELLKKKREELKIEAMESREAVKDKIKAEREEYKKKLEGIRDERKKLRLENLDTRIEAINANKTKHLLEVLERLSQALIKIEEKAADLKSKGVEVSNVNTTVVTAKADIEAAKTMINTQASKSYVIDITTETTLRDDAGTTISELKTDLTSSIEAVKKAKQSVQDAFEALRKLRLSVTQ